MHLRCCGVHQDHARSPAHNHTLSARPSVASGRDEPALQMSASPIADIEPKTVAVETPPLTSSLTQRHCVPSTGPQGFPVKIVD